MFHSGEARAPGLSHRKVRTAGYKVFSEADPDSVWFESLEERRCKEIIRLLKRKPMLLKLTSHQERTALHVAVIQGCAHLVEQILELFNTVPPAGFDLTVAELLDAVDGRCQETALHIAVVVGNGNVLRILKRAISSRSARPRHESHLLNGAPATTPGQGSGPSIGRNEPMSTIRDPLVTLRSIVQQILDVDKKQDYKYKFLEEEYGNQTEFEFVEDCKEFLLHFTFTLKKSTGYQMIEGVKPLQESIVGGAKDALVLEFLFTLQDAQGRCPLHVAADYNVVQYALDLIPRKQKYNYIVNSADGAGRTALHRAAAQGFLYAVRDLLHDRRANCNALICRTEDADLARLLPESCKYYKATPLHLAILHNYTDCVDKLAQTERHTKCVNKRLGRPSKPSSATPTSHPDYQSPLEKIEFWSPLQLAAVLGHVGPLRVLMQVDKAFDVGRLNQPPAINNDERIHPHAFGISASHLAAASGNPEAVHMFLQDERFDVFIQSSDDQNALQFATDATMVEDMRILTDFVTPRQLEMQAREMERQSERYSGKRVCISLLLQAGIDIHENDRLGKTPNPGPLASKDDRVWWYEKVAQETLEVKKNLTAAANATSVIAALVATASFIGPLQPPLSYGAYQDSTIQYVHITVLPVRVFITCNGFSFYFAVASILMAMIPSLPMPRESLLDELRRIQRTVAVAFSFLLVSIICVLIAFAAASIAVIPKEWHYEPLPYSSVVLGGLICLGVIFLLCLRLSRMIFPKSKFIRLLYKRLAKL